MTICDECKSSYCINACCYITFKRINEWEVENLGEENIIRRGEQVYLRNEPYTNACVFLNEEEGYCTIYDKRPNVCKIYSCQGENLELLIQEISFRKKKVKENLIKKL